MPGALIVRPVFAFAVILREALLTDHGYVFLFALNVFSFSGTAELLTGADWERLAGRSPAIPYELPALLGRRIIETALETGKAVP